MQVVAEWFVAVSSSLASAGAWLADLNWGTLEGLLSVLISLVGIWVTLRLHRTANRAKLESTGEIVKSKTIPMLDLEEIQIKIENTGPKDVLIKHIEMCRVKCSIGLRGRKLKYTSCKTVHSKKEHESRLDAFQFASFHHPVKLHHPVNLSDANPSDVLGSGKSCDRFMSKNFPSETNVHLAELAKTKDEAKTVQFVVCTDAGKFPVESDEDLKEFVVSKILSAQTR